MSETTSVLELARKALARIKARRNGHHAAFPGRLTDALDASIRRSTCAESAISAESLTIPAAVRSPAPPTDYRLVTHAEDLRAVLAALGDAERVGLDLETTGLSPHQDRGRLLQLAVPTIDGGTFAYLVDCFAVDPALLWPALDGLELVLHNAAFDLAFLWRLGFRPSGPVYDLLIMSRLLTAGTLTGHALEDLAGRELAVSLDKSHQKDDWSQPHLSPDQLAYAALDARVTLDLYPKLRGRIAEAKLDRAAEIERRALPAFLWMATAGAPFDPAAWQALLEDAGHQAEALARDLDEAAPRRPGFLSKTAAWKWDSPQDTLEAFRHLGLDLPDTRDETLAGVNHPLAGLLRQHRSVSKGSSAFGAAWLEHVHGGRIFARWNQLGTDAGRTSCAKPNIPQVPRDPRYRRCFRAPEGRVLVKADYSQLQLRIAAKIARERRMLDAYARRDDLHTLTARSLTGKDQVTKEERQLAKAVNFGLLFGLGAKGLQSYARGEYGLDLTEDEASPYRQAFFEAVPVLFCHDEIVIEAEVSQAEAAAAWLRQAMLDGMTPLIDPVPVEVEVETAPTWGG
jgi:DNA polymerase-1